MNQRELALEIIYKTIKDSAYAGLLMRQKLNEIEPLKRPFVSNLVYGVLREYDYLLFQVENDIKNNTSLKNKIIIVMALYEKHFLNKENHIVINEYVSLAKNKYDKAFINALLHKNIDLALKESKDAYINNSLPKWLYSLLESQYSKSDLDKILKNYKRIPKTYYRINHLKCLKEELNDVEFINDDIFISSNNLLNSDDFKNGKYYIQDINSSLLVKNLHLKSDDILLDMCSAPGSKLFNALDIIKPFNAYANELYEKRLNLIKDKAKILGFEAINYLNYDGLCLKDKLNLKFDKIILDVPCSGLGTLGRKPDLKYHVTSSSLDELEKIQKGLLDSAKCLIKEKGEILYSTCTLNKKENSKQILRFCKENSMFKLIKEETIINEMGDCFYYALLERSVL